MDCILQSRSFSQACLKQYHLLGEMLICACITTAISVLFMFDSKLMKEPTTQNPFKLIYKVIHYAIKHKHPLRRSAFTYCEDELPSRIDFGKSKYGGPFTTEQVEDVKTFLRLLLFTIIGSIIASVIITLHNLKYQLIKVFVYAPSNTLTTECYRKRYFTSGIGYSAVALLIPVNHISNNTQVVSFNKNMLQIYIRCNTTNVDSYFLFDI